MVRPGRPADGRARVIGREMRENLGPWRARRRLQISGHLEIIFFTNIAQS